MPCNHTESIRIIQSLRLGHLGRLGLKPQLGHVERFPTRRPTPRRPDSTEASYALLREPRRSFGLAAINGYGWCIHKEIEKRVRSVGLAAFEPSSQAKYNSLRLLGLTFVFELQSFLRDFDASRIHYYFKGWVGMFLKTCSNDMFDLPQCSNAFAGTHISPKSLVFGSWKPVALAPKQIRIVTIVKFFIDWTSNLVELDSHGKSPCPRSVSLPSSTREGSKAADGTNKICPLLGVGAWTHCSHSCWHETTQTLYTLFHTKLFLFQIASGHIQHLSFSTHLSGVQSHPYEGQMWQSATYLRTVGCIWGEKWHQRLDVDSGKIRSPRRWWRGNGVQELQT